MDIFVLFFEMGRLECLGAQRGPVYGFLGWHMCNLVDFNFFGFFRPRGVFFFSHSHLTDFLEKSTKNTPKNQKNPENELVWESHQNGL